MATEPRNAADRDQVDKSQAAQDKARYEYLKDMEWVLSDPRGRRVIWNILEETKVFGEVWDPGVRIHFNVARQDYGKKIMGDVVDVGPGVLVNMMVENQKQKEKK